MLEKEYKAMLDKSNFEKIKHAFLWDSVKVQTNYYYTDDDGILRENRVMFRVREKDGKCVIQIKYHKNKNSPLQICEENEFRINNVPEIIENGEKYTKIKTGPLKLLGNARTQRYSKMWDDNTEICLDKTEYLGICDYEIEVEYTADTIPDDLTEKLNSLGVEFIESSCGKFSRFLNELKQR